MAARDSRSKPASRRDKAPPAAAERGRERPSGNLFWLFGVHAVLAALRNPRRKVVRLALTPEAARAHAAALAEARALRPLPAEEATERRDLDHALPPGAVHQGIAALVEPLPIPAIEDIAGLAEGRDHAVVVVLDQVTDPHNVGAILRSAAAFGALAVVVPDRHSPEETGTLAKSASGALERLPLVRVTNVVRAIEDLKAAGFWVAGLAGEAPRTLAEEKLSGRVALVMGAEGEGLRRLTREHCDYLVRLPMTGAVESLNVSNAAAVALYELVRERLNLSGGNERDATE
ncbi:23S rRNA (guanosine(2251)-2'-O)-methyltransferase RlmB [Magnetospirillum sp. UT-4]|uniref:23S rRNA (guanosine(2251)-2'-O)-methyltransferase RlmB n=1 Tax=Magnetospirillum sp. UT-4 TaxID=2681467 RepID=UPI00137D47C0|nr:23S rRNA (guanosine(2251)-2'-O)-methyltransferase RlmB [Magnetospirillum sp. UT-4]CAA7626137.1 23S rRNA (guanosine-2'-O-)-methyltransferase RlmB [Magnetospirillum sp. UT-4]